MTAQLTFSLTEAAERLGGIFTVDWLRAHLHELPHLRGMRPGTGKPGGKPSGRAGRIGFTEAQLDQIVAMFTVLPEVVRPGTFTPNRPRGRRAS